MSEHIKTEEEERFDIGVKKGRFFFISDIHFGHTNIIKFCKRPFLFDQSKGFEDKDNLDINGMDEALIKNWNNVVGPEDSTYILGDFAFYRDQQKTRNVIRKLNGNKILIRGNHDEYLEPKTLGAFGSVHYYYELNVPDNTLPRGKQMIILLHYSMNVWNRSHRGSWHLFGHSHNTLPDNPNALSFDVGVDCHNYTPISYEQVKAIMSKKTFKPIDYHGDR